MTHKGYTSEGLFMKYRNKKLVYTLTGALLISMLAGCNGTDNADAQTEVENKLKVKTEAPQVKSISVQGDFIGTVESEEQIFVMSKASGDVTETFFEVGDTVNAGDLLFTIDDTTAQMQLKQAQATLNTANASLNTARASVNSANAAANAAQASVNENFAKSSTTDMQLQAQIDSAEVSFYNNEQNIGLLESQINKLNESIETTEKSLDGLKAKSVEAAAVYAASQTADNKKAMEDAASKYATTLTNVESMKSQRDQLRVQYESAKRSNCLLVENADIARASKADYDNYTKATIGNAGLSQLAQSQAGIAQAQAAVTQSQSGITQAEIAVESAQLQLDYTMVTAPVSGIITAKNVSKNNMVAPGNVAYTIMSDSNKYVSLFVSEEVMRELNVGQIITVDRNGVKYDAVITENPGVADAQTGLFKVKALIDSKDNIINGTKVKITMATRNAENTLTVPISAVYHETEKSYVYTIVDGKATKVYVTTGLFDDEKIEIIDGITADNQVITTWSNQLRNGVEVETENSSDSASAANAGTIIVERNDG